jgi:hypothetical protein
MSRLYGLITILASTILLVAHSANPPDGKTGAPGESLCVECHTQSNDTIDGEISVEGFPDAITPGEDYILTVVNRNTIGDAVKGGFQLTILSPFNTKAGVMTKPSADATVTQTFSGRQYFEHDPATVYPDSNVLKWTVQWTAPALAAGSNITWWVAGVIANGNFENKGDRVVTDHGSGAIMISATEDLIKEKPILYPNPGTGSINIILGDRTLPEGEGIFYSLTGDRVGVSEINMGNMITPNLPPGVYVVEIKQGELSYVTRWTKIR